MSTDEENVEYGTIFEFRAIRDTINKAIKDDDLESAGIDVSKAFIYFFLQQYFQLDKIDALDAIVDGSNDYGIDAVYIDDNGESADVYLIQSKNYQADQKFNRSLEGAAVDKMILAIQGLITQPGSMPQYANSQLAKKLEDITDIGMHARFHIVFISNSYPLTKNSQEQINDFVKKHNRTSEYFTWNHVYLAKYANLLPRLQEVSVSGEIQLTGDYMLHDVGVARAVIGRIKGEELAKIVDEHGDLLFDKNVRGYLKKSNQVNKKIRISASSVDSKKFFFLNNGITIVCKKFDFNAAFSENPQIKLTDFQIVNGGQTTNAIHEVAKEGKLDKNVSVLIRVVETGNVDLLKDITEATNSQTLVSNRDLHSNDPVQKLIESYFETQGFYYESRKNKYQGGPIARLRVDADKAAQTYYAYHYEKPADAKSKKSKLFESLYPVIFDQDEFDEKEYLFSYLLYKKLYELRDDFSDYGFIRDAELTSLALFRNNSEIHSLDDLKKVDEIKKSYKLILEKMQAVINEEVAIKGENFEKRRFFIAQDSMGRIQEKLLK